MSDLGGHDSIRREHRRHDRDDDVTGHLDARVRRGALGGDNGGGAFGGDSVVGSVDLVVGSVDFDDPVDLDAVDLVGAERVGAHERQDTTDDVVITGHDQRESHDGRRVKVLHVTEAYGGGVSTALSWYTELTGPDVEHVLVARRRPTADVGADPEHARLIELPSGFLSGFMAFRRAVAREHPDVIHAHSSLAGVWARMLPTPQPVVYTPHCLACERTDVNALVRGAFRAVELSLAWRTSLFVANGTREQHLCEGLGRNARAISVPCMPVEHTYVTEPRSPRREGDPFVVVTAGRVLAQKDPAWFARVAEIVRETAPDRHIEFRWVGGGIAASEQTLTAAGVCVLGWMPRAKVIEEVVQADLYLHAAAWEAGCPLSVLEALELGVPVIVREIAAFDGLGMTTVEDPAAAAAMILSIESDPSTTQLEEITAQGDELLQSLHREAEHAGLSQVYRSLVPPAADSTRPLDVTIVFPSVVYGGAEAWLFGLLDADQTNGETNGETDGDKAGRTNPVNVRLRAVLLSDGPVQAALEARGIPTTVLPTGRRAHEVAIASFRLWRILRDDRPDVVLANGVKAAFAAMPAARFAGVRSVWAKHDFVWDKPYGHVAARWFDDVVATSRELLTNVGATNGRVLMPPMPDIALLDRDAARDELAAIGVVLDERPVLAMICRIVSYKGIDDAIRALSFPGGEGWQLVVVGSEDANAPGTLRSLQELTETLRVQDRVHFAGHVAGASRLFKAFDAVAVLTKSHPDSRYRAEGFSITALEAVVAGIPVIATSTTPALRVLGTAGISVEPHAPHAVAAALEQIVANGPLDPAVTAEILEPIPTLAGAAQQLWSVLSQTARRSGAHIRPQHGPPVSVVTTVLNENDTSIEAWLVELTTQLRDGDEIVVVDGGSTDGTDEVIELVAAERNDIRLVRAPGTNIAAGRNAGVRAARNDIVAVTDAGCDVRAGWLDALRVGFTDESVDLVTGVYEPSVTGPIDEAFALVGFPAPEEAIHPGPLVRAYGRLLGRVFDPRLCTGRSSAFRRSAWEAVGGYPEDLATAEDVAFGLAIADRGGRCVLTIDAGVVWHQRPTVKAKLAMYAGYGRGDADSGDALLIGRNIVRGVGLAAGPLMLLQRRRSLRAAAAAGALAYLSLPLRRARVRRSSPLAIAAVVPVALLRESTKAAACAVRVAHNRIRR